MSIMSQAETNKRFGIVAGGFVASIFVCVIVGSITGYNAAQTKAPATVGGLKADHIIWRRKNLNSEAKQCGLRAASRCDPRIRKQEQAT